MMSVMPRSIAMLRGLLAISVLVACADEDTGTGGAAHLGGSGGGGSSSSGFGGSGGEPLVGGGCVGTSDKADPIPLDIFIMLDQSGSMLQDAGNQLTRWEMIQAAIGAFVDDDASAGIGIGINYFGQPDAAVPGCHQMPCSIDTDCTGGCAVCLPSGVCEGPYNPDIDSCDPQEYAWAEVPIAPLPGSADAIKTNIASHSPGTNTPTQPALEGAIDYAKAWAADHPDHVTVVAFATDGEPAECDLDPQHMSDAAAAGFSGSPSVQTFVIGVGPAIAVLDAIAAAGGTEAAFHVDLDDMATEHFRAALNTIRGAAIDCTYLLPEPPDGMALDLDRVNVVYRPGDGSQSVDLLRYEDEAACPDDGAGWYYAGGTPPTQLVLCPATCESVTSDIGAEVDVVLGCETLVP